MGVATRWADGHLDLAYLAVRGQDLCREPADPALGCLSLPALRQARVELIFGTIFTEPGISGEAHPHGYADSNDLQGAEAAGLRQVKLYEQLREQQAISIVRAASELDQPGASPKLIMLMEGADPIRSPDDVLAWYERGVRIVGLTWAMGTRYAGGNVDGGPLTPLGRAMIRALDAVGTIHDASHLSDAAFDALLEHATGRIIASHSNCRALVDNKQRHLRDDQIKAIAERGGVIGLNLFGRFLAVGRRATIADCVAHVNRIVELMGHRRGVALGSDMDGGFGPAELPVGLDHPTKLNALADALHDAGWADDEIEGFAYGNWRRFIEQALR